MVCQPLLNYTAGTVKLSGAHAQVGRPAQAKYTNAQVRLKEPLQQGLF